MPVSSTEGCTRTTWTRKTSSRFTEWDRDNSPTTCSNASTSARLLTDLINLCPFSLMLPNLTGQFTFRYNSGAKKFIQVTTTKHISATIDAVCTYNTYWTKKKTEKKAPVGYCWMSRTAGFLSEVGFEQSTLSNISSSDLQKLQTFLRFNLAQARVSYSWRAFNHEINLIVRNLNYLLVFSRQKYCRT